MKYRNPEQWARSKTATSKTLLCLIADLNEEATEAAIECHYAATPLAAAAATEAWTIAEKNVSALREVLGVWIAGTKATPGEYLQALAGASVPEEQARLLALADKLERALTAPRSEDRGSAHR